MYPLKQCISLLLVLLWPILATGQSTPNPVITGFGGSSLPPAATSLDSTFCQGGTLSLEGQHFISAGPGTTWDSTSFYLGGVKCALLSLNATQGGNNDAALIALPDAWNADTCLKLEVVKFVRNSFGTLPYVGEDTICLRGPFVQVSYEDSIFCLGDTSPRPLIQGNAPGAFCCISGTPGFTLLSDGTIPLHSGAVGTQQFSYTVTDSFCPDTTRFSVDILATTTPVVSYQNQTSLSYCPRGSALADTAGLSPKGGTFICNDPGLVILDDSLGAIDLEGSQSGSYQLGYRVDLPCYDTAWITLTIRPADTAGLNYPSQICENSPPVSPVFYAGASGGSFWSVPAGLVLAGDGTIDPALSQPGSYEVYYAPPGLCPDTTLADTIALDSLPNAGFFLADSVCAVDSFLAVDSVVSAGKFDIYRNGQIIHSTTSSQIPVSGLLNGSQTYLVAHVVTGAGICADTAWRWLSVLPGENPAFSYPASRYCLSGDDPLPLIQGNGGGTFSGLSPSTQVGASDGLVDVVGSGAGTHIIQYTTAGPCPATARDTITIVASLSAQFSYPQSDYCTTEANPLPTVADSGGTFTATGGLNIDSVSGEIDLSQSAAGTYPVTYAFSGSCQDQYSQSITIKDFDSSAVLIYPADTFCVDSTPPQPLYSGDSVGGFNGSPGLVFFNPGLGSVDLTRTPPGTYSVTFDISNRCATDPVDSFQVAAGPALTFNYSDPSFCQSNPPLTPLVSPAGLLVGGSFGAAPVGLETGSDGTIDPAGSLPGSYQVAFTTGGLCPSVAVVPVEVRPDPRNLALEILPDSAICEQTPIDLRITTTDGISFKFLRNGTPVDSGSLTHTIAVPNNGDRIGAVVENAFGCSDTVESRISVSPRPQIAVQSEGGSSVLPGAYALEVISTLDATVVDWQLLGGNMAVDSGALKLFQAGTPAGLSLDLEGSELSPEFYTLQLIPRASNCTGDSVRIQMEATPKEVWIPEIITPNGDGANDTWKIRWIDSVDPTLYEILLFNRAGGQVARIAPLTDQWTPPALPDGVYWWTLLQQGKAIDQGGLTILRKPKQ